MRSIRTCAMASFSKNLIGQWKTQLSSAHFISKKDLRQRRENVSRVENCLVFLKYVYGSHNSIATLFNKIARVKRRVVFTIIFCDLADS